MTRKKRSNVQELLAALQRTTGQDSPASKPPPAPPDSESRSAGRRRIGKAVQFWIHDEDRRLIRELAAWLAAQGVRASDSVVIRAALRTVKTGPDFMQAYQSAASLDGRRRDS